MIIRSVSALVLASPLLWLLLAGPSLYLVPLVVLVAMLLAYEWHKLCGPFSLYHFLWLLFGVLLILSSWIPGLGVTIQAETHTLTRVAWLPLSGLCSLVLLIFFAEGVLRYRAGQWVLEEVGRRFFGVLYCTLPLALLLEIRHAEQGEWLVFFLLLTIWATDIGALFAGRRWGKRKLAPHVSAGKTWVGSLGGVVLASATGGTVACLCSLPYDWLDATLLGAVLSVVGQMGDLAESLAKREANVKDSGQLIPGHGGVLDRLDSLLFAAPVYYLFLWMHALIPTSP
ncbi:MAG: phosphatidate cytidylyltransferase [Magnetococcales bacterium]|nr:phosphatidate cytidylyltransferase [Magnetococcales bacterium]